MSQRLSSVIGLVPAAGRATRLGELACSKEVLPVPQRDGHGQRPAIAHVLEAFATAGIGTAIVVVRPDKHDVIEVLRERRSSGPSATWLTIDETPSVVHTLARAAPSVTGRIVALGFPDILFEPVDAFGALLERLETGGAEVVLGLFPTEQCEKTDMVKLDENGRVAEVVIKQPPCGLRYTWSIAVWRPRFTAHLCDEARAHESGGELQVGQVLQRAVDRGFRVDAVVFEHGEYLDIGTPDDLARARRGTSQ